MKNDIIDMSLVHLLAALLHTMGLCSVRYGSFCSQVFFFLVHQIVVITHSGCLSGAHFMI
jgi:hypothetical protein